MSVKCPEFVSSPYFVPDPDNWHLKDEAPKEVVDEFNEYMKSYQDALEGGAIL